MTFGSKGLSKHLFLPIDSHCNVNFEKSKAIFFFTTLALMPIQESMLEALTYNRHSASWLPALNNICNIFLSDDVTFTIPDLDKTTAEH